MTDETEAMRTEEGFKDYTAKQLRNLEASIVDLSASFNTVLDEHSASSKRRFDIGEARMDRIEAKQDVYIDVLKETKSDVQAVQRGLAENTRITNEQSKRYDKQEEGIDEVLSLLSTAKGVKTASGWGVKLAFGVGTLAGAWTAVTTAIHGKLPWN